MDESCNPWLCAKSIFYPNFDTHFHESLSLFNQWMKAERKKTRVRLKVNLTKINRMILWEGRSAVSTTSPTHFSVNLYLFDKKYNQSMPNSALQYWWYLSKRNQFHEMCLNVHRAQKPYPFTVKYNRQKNLKPSMIFTQLLLQVTVAVLEVRGIFLHLSE